MFSFVLQHLRNNRFMWVCVCVCVTSSLREWYLRINHTLPVLWNRFHATSFLIVWLALLVYFASAWNGASSFVTAVCSWQDTSFPRDAAATLHLVAFVQKATGRSSSSSAGPLQWIQISARYFCMFLWLRSDQLAYSRYCLVALCCRIMYWRFERFK
jgi:hypothetical protein